MLKRILAVAQREYGILTSRAIYVMCMVVFPLLVTVFFTSIMDEGQPQDMPVGVVDLDNSSTTRKLVRMLDSFQSSEVVAHYYSVDEAREAVQRGEIYGFLYFPAQTTDKLLSGRQPKISFYYTNTSLTAGSLVYKDMKTVCTLASAAVGQATLQAKGLRKDQMMAILQPISVDAHNVGNPWVSYNIYLSTMLVPGCLLLFVFLMTAYSFGTEFKFGTNKELMEVAGDNLFVAIVGKLSLQTVVYTITMWISLVYMFGILHFPVAGHTALVFFLGFLTVVASQGFALFIFAIMPSLRMSMSISSLWSVLSFSMVGSAFPVFAMDKPLEMLANLFPLRHYYMIYQLCIFNDFPLTDAGFHVVMLVAFIFMPWILYKRLGNAMRNFTYMA